MKKIWRTIAAVVLAVCLLCEAIPVQAADDTLRVLLAADTHYYAAADLGEMTAQYTDNMLDSELYYHASSQGQMNYESRAVVQAMLDDFVSGDVPYLLIAGDLTGGRRQSHLELAQMLRDAETKSGKSVFVINGNHDCAASDSGERIGMRTFREIYYDFGYDRALSVHDDSASYTADLSKTYRLLAIDSCIYGEDEGQITPSEYAWIGEQIDRAEQDSKTLIAMLHHSVLPHYALQPMMDGYTALAQYLADNGVHLALTGHIHANDIASAQTKRGSVLYDLQTGSLITSPNTYRCLTFAAGKVDVQSRFVTAIDASLLPDGFSDAQLAAIRADFPAYAAGYFEAGVCKWFNRNLGSPDRLARWFKVREGAALYATLERLTGKIGDAIGLDMYSTGDGNSMASILSSHGETLEESGYTKLYQPAAKIMYGFFHGDEADVSSDLEVRLLRQGVKAAVLYGMQTTFPNSARLTQFAARLPGAGTAQSAADAVTDALLSSLADGFVSDYSAPQDLNVTLALTDAPSGGVLPLSRVARVWNIVVRFFRLLFSIDVL